MSVVKGSATLYLSREDASGNVGYSLEFEYTYNQDGPEKSIKYSDIKFSGPGTWEDFSEGDDYPFGQMFEEVMRDAK